MGGTTGPSVVDGAGEWSRGRGDKIGGRSTASTPPGGRGGRLGVDGPLPLGDLLWITSEDGKVLGGRGGTDGRDGALTSGQVSVGGGDSGEGE